MKKLSLSLMTLLSSSVMASQELTVYTYDAFAADWGPAPAIEQAFEAVCDCDLKFVAADSSLALLRKVQLEGDSTPADVILGLDTNSMELARSTGLFATPQWDPSVLSLPVEWSETQFVPFDYSIFAMVYQKDRLPNPPASLEALRSLPEDVKFVIQDPRSSTPGLGFVLWVKSVYGDQAVDFWRDIQDSVLTVTAGWSEAYNLFLEGEAEMVLSYTTSPAYHRIAENDDRFAWASFAEGHQGQIEIAGRLKSSNQPELADRFMQFITTEGFQSAIPTGNWAYPVIDLPLPEGFEAQARPQPFRLADPVAVEAVRKQAVDEFFSVFGG
ncbi:MAG: thiamine ABC transporter substrate binding subunit [Litorivicinus sp.]